MLKQRQDSIAKFCAGISVHFRMRQSECQIIGHSALADLALILRSVGSRVQGLVVNPGQLRSTPFSCILGK